MVVGQVAENATGKSEPRYAVLHYAVAAHLHEGVLASCLHHSGQQGVQLKGIGRGMRGGHLVVVNLVDNCGEEPRVASHSAEQAMQEGDGGGLSVGAGDADKLEAARGMTVPVVGHHAQRVVAVLHKDKSDALILLFRHALADHGSSALLHSGRYIIVPVHAGPHLCHEATALPHLARVEADVRHLWVARHRAERCDSFYKRLQSHFINS